MEMKAFIIVFSMKLIGKPTAASYLRTTGELCTPSFGKNILIEQILVISEKFSLNSKLSAPGTTG